MRSSMLRGALAAMAAFFIWGLFPLFWSLLGDVPALQVLAHRALWCAGRGLGCCCWPVVKRHG